MGLSIKGKIQQNKQDSSLTKYCIVTSLMTFVKLSTTIALPLYFNDVGYDITLISLYIAVIGFSRSGFALIGGMLSDLIGIRKILLLSIAVGAFSQIGLITANPMPLLFIFIVLDGASYGAFMAIRGPIIASLAELKDRGTVFGLFGAVSNILGVCGGLCVGIIMEAFSSSSMFVILFFIHVITFCFAFSISIDKLVVHRNTDKRRMGEAIKGIPLILWMMLFLNIIQTTVTSPLWDVVIPLYFTAVIQNAAFYIGLVYSIDSLFSIVSSFMLGRISDKVDSYKLAIVSCLGMGILSLLVCFSTQNIILFIVFYLLLNIVFSGLSPVLEKIESSTVRESFKGFDYSLLRVSLTIGPAIGNLLAGFVISKWMDYGIFFYIVAAGYGIVAFILYGMRKLSIVVS